MQASNENRLSIQLRPDGLSFACLENGSVRSGLIRRSEGGFEAIFSDPEWPQREFAEIGVCVPTEYAVLIPAGFDRPEYYETLFVSLGCEEDPGARILARPCPDGRVLLHGVCEAVFQPLLEKYGGKLTFFHPLSINLIQSDEDETVLCVDAAAGTGNYTLSRSGELLFADVFPLTDEASLLLAIDRIVAGSPAETLRIVCSGETCEAMHRLLSRHFPCVSVHPDGENRDLFFPLR